MQDVHDDEKIKIIVNGSERHVENKPIDFHHLVKLAFDSEPTGPNVDFTITYRNGPPENPQGTLLRHHNVALQRDMVFNVTATDKS
jgi:Multiubiquitin